MNAKKVLITLFVLCILIGSVWAPLGKALIKEKTTHPLKIKVGGFIKKIIGKVVILKPAASTITESEPASTSVDTYPWHYNIMSTTFWFGEEPSEDNSWISNAKTAWDETIVEHYGGYDDPECRDGYYPCGFVPKENPFYVALPYNDYTDEGERKENSKQIPWYTGNEPKDYSIMKNKWVEIKYGETTCYGQIEDTGPYEEDDFEYVFGTAQPKNQIGSKSGIDISPALRTCLNRNDNKYVDWKFIEENNVPSGPWKEIITTSQINWE